nr:unnamed protein product [Digitaria exilis]CAB3469184.1 unnamed protein product [Digitaria exilis]
MVAALEDDRSALARGRFVLYLYNSKVHSWSVANVSLEAQHWQRYQDDGYFMHRNTRAIAVGGADATIAFVDLWRGILLCDLSHAKDKPWLRYSCLDSQLLPKPVDNEQPFLTLNVAHPTLSWHDDHTVWFMLKMAQFDAKAWVIAVDVVNNRLQGVAHFDAERYTAIGFAYLHSRISKYLNKATTSSSPHCKH